MIDRGRLNRDVPTVTPEGESLAKLPAGVRFHPVTTQTDDRGTLCEMAGPLWPWADEPIVYAYFVTLRPGKVKGWALHKEHEDRYFMMFGELEVVLYDVRPDSPTKGLLAKVALSEHNRRAMNIPAGVWHADHNIGSKDAVIVNFPTKAYDHHHPDKYRLPLDTDQIPYSFHTGLGW